MGCSFVPPPPLPKSKGGGGEAFHQCPRDAVAYCSRFLLTCALLMASLHSKAIWAERGTEYRCPACSPPYGRPVQPLSQKVEDDDDDDSDSDDDSDGVDEDGHHGVAGVHSNQIAARTMATGKAMGAKKAKPCNCHRTLCPTCQQCVVKHCKCNADGTALIAKPRGKPPATAVGWDGATGQWTYGSEGPQSKYKGRGAGSVRGKGRSREKGSKKRRLEAANGGSSGIGAGSCLSGGVAASREGGLADAVGGAASGATAAGSAWKGKPATKGRQKKKAGDEKGGKDGGLAKRFKPIKWQPCTKCPRRFRSAKALRSHEQAHIDESERIMLKRLMQLRHGSKDRGRSDNSVTPLPTESARGY